MPSVHAIRPFPVPDLGHVFAVDRDILFMLYQLVVKPFLDSARCGMEFFNAVDNVVNEIETIDLVHDRHVERGSSRAFLFVASHVKVPVIGPAVYEPVD